MAGSRIACRSDDSFYHADLGYVVAEITENEPGYRVASAHSELADAQAEAARRNEENGISADDALDILASSMRAGKVSRPL